MTVLIPSSDHGYVGVVVRKMKVVFNKKHRSYSEYMGDD
jgi:hypothetical protein